MLEYLAEKASWKAFFSTELQNARRQHEAELEEAMLSGNVDRIEDACKRAEGTGVPR